MCPCYKEKFFAAGSKYIYNSIHFKCKCRQKLFFYVLFCKDHPFRTRFVATGDYTLEMEEKCNCKSGLFHVVCGFCFSVRHLLNFRCYKICVEEVPDYFVERVFPLDAYLKKMNCDLFFFRSNKTRLIEVSLDNPYEDNMPVKTDYKFISSS